MNGISIDLATASNVLATVVNLILVAINLLILGQIQRISFAQDMPSLNLLGSLRNREQSGSTEKLPVLSASDSKMAEREKLRNEADTLETNEEISKITDAY